MKTEECDEQDCYASDTFEIVTPCSARFRLDLGAPISLKAATRSFCQTRREECGQKDWSACRKFGIIIPFSVTYFLEVRARVLFKGFLEVKNLLKLKFLDYFSKRKTEECDQEDSSVSDTFEIITPSSPTYYLNKWHPFQWATKASFWGRKTENLNFEATFPKQKRSRAPKILSLSDKFEMLMSGLDTNFLEVSAEMKFSIFRLFFWSENEEYD